MIHSSRAYFALLLNLFTRFVHIFASESISLFLLLINTYSPLRPLQSLRCNTPWPQRVSSKSTMRNARSTASHCWNGTRASLREPWRTPSSAKTRIRPLCAVFSLFILWFSAGLHFHFVFSYLSLLVVACGQCPHWSCVSLGKSRIVLRFYLFYRLTHWFLLTTPIHYFLNNFLRYLPIITHFLNFLYFPSKFYRLSRVIFISFDYPSIFLLSLTLFRSDESGTAFLSYFINLSHFFTQTSFIFDFSLISRFFT